VIYVYAITDRGAALPRTLRGLKDRPLWPATCGAVSAVCSRHEAPSPRPAVEQVRRHEHVVERLMEDRPILPARYGILFPTARRFYETLDAHRDALAAGLDEVRGHVELGVRALWRKEPAPRSGSRSSGAAAVRSGREYMAARLAEDRDRQGQEERLAAAAAEIHRPLADLARRSVQLVVTSPAALFTGAYLVAPPRIETFRRRVEDLAAVQPEVCFLCTGPWPPYHFVPQLHVRPKDDVRFALA
jgi:hypothetical protein